MVLETKQLFTRALAALALTLAAGGALADRVTIDIDGLSDEQLAAARANLELEQYLNRDVTAAEIERVYDRAEDQIAAALRPFGYYNVAVQSDLRRDGKDFHASFRVERGAAVRVVEENVKVTGPGADDEVVRKALAEFKPAKGDQLDDALYEAGKARVDAALRAQGYLDARQEQHRVAVTASANTARIDVVWQSGARYRFGPVQFSTAQFPAEFLQRFVPWKEGDFYSEAQLLELQQRLVDADYFAAVSVRPDLERANGNVAPIAVLIVPAKRSVYSGDLYYSTDSGPGVRFSFDRRWLNRRGHKLGADLDYSQRLQELSTTYHLPLPGAERLRYDFGAAYRDEQTATSRSRNAQLAAVRADAWHGFTRTIGLKFLTGDFDIGTTHGNADLLYAEGTLSRKRADSVFFTRDGSTLTVALDVGPEHALSDTEFAQVRANYKWIHSMSDRDRLILRGALGAMTVGDFDRLPPTLRFFAGGDRSVRGFGYQQIGEVNAAGDVIGGKYLAVGSAEYERYFLPNWGAAAFVDAGDAFSSSLDANIGAGLGVRWKSPIGLVRVDFAQAITSQLRKTWRIHVVIGPDL